MPSEHCLLQAHNLACERDDRQLFRDLSLTAHAGECWQVVGANGSGKTTLLRMLAGLFTHYDGELHWHLPGDIREHLLFIGDRPGMRAELTPLENLNWLNALHGLHAADAWTALARAGLRGFEDVPLTQLSAGQKRRAALDAAGVATVETRLADYVARGGLLLYTSHHAVGSNVRRLELGA